MKPLESEVNVHNHNAFASGRRRVHDRPSTHKKIAQFPGEPFMVQKGKGPTLCLVCLLLALMTGY
jgi:hypothetical protein